MYGPATKVAAALRAGGASVDLLPTHKKARWAFDYANRVGAVRTAYVAPAEWAQGEVAIKDMRADREEAGVVIQANVPFGKLGSVDSFFGGGDAGGGGGDPALRSELAKAQERIALLTERIEALEIP
eukprot:COSAG05_NODE_3788_length_1836_cov_1.213011_3_plen_127_part_00